MSDCYRLAAERRTDRLCNHLRAFGLAYPGWHPAQSFDFRTSISQPGENGSKPCSTSQRTDSRQRIDHQARTMSRSTSPP
jgi:hypothetical protein